MGTSSVSQAGKYVYLSPCAHCGADNGVTATNCWRCESAIASSGPTGLDLMLGRDRTPAPAAADPNDQSATVHDARRPAEGEPSFFPVLREEVPGTPDAANDAPGAEAPRVLKSRTLSAKLSLALAAALVAVIAFAPDLFDAPPPVPAVAVATPAADLRDARLTPIAHVAATTAAVAPKETSSAVVPPAAPPSPACTAAVDALGLCPAPVH
jgi:hypothetical protein